MDTKQAAVRAFIQDLLEITCPSKLIQGARRHERHNRTLPALLFPWLEAGPDTSHPVLTTTKDLSTGGGSLLLQQEFPWDEFLITLPYGQAPVFVLSEVRHRTPLVFGFWQLGVMWRELVAVDTCRELEHVASLMKQLQVGLSNSAH